MNAIVLSLISHLPDIIKASVKLVDNFKGASGADKKVRVVTEFVPDAIELIEGTAGKDLLNDPAVAALVSAVVDAEAAALKAKNALRAGLLAHA